MYNPFAHSESTHSLLFAPLSRTRIDDFDDGQILSHLVPLSASSPYVFLKKDHQTTTLTGCGFCFKIMLHQGTVILGRDVLWFWSMNILVKERAKTTKTLLAEVRLLRSAIMGFLGKDPEGNYRAEFVARALKNAAKKPTKQFTNAAKFLKELEAYE